MQAGIADHVWSLEELVGLLERRAAKAQRNSRRRQEMKWIFTSEPVKYL